MNRKLSANDFYTSSNDKSHGPKPIANNISSLSLASMASSLAAEMSALMRRLNSAVVIDEEGSIAWFGFGGFDGGIKD